MLEAYNFTMKLMTTLLERTNLFLYCYSKGVSLAYLSKSQVGVAKDLEQLLQNSPDFSKELSNHFDDARRIYAETVQDVRIKVASESWNAEMNLCVLLFSYIRVNQPKFVVETGVANGITTRVMMSALSEYGGHLHSFDILTEASSVYQGNGHWYFHLLTSAGAVKEINLLVQDFPEIDMWVHDSNHGSTWQEFEYRLAMSKLSKNGILVSDDIDASPAWAKVSREILKNPWAIFDARKVIGIAHKKIT
jgi:predicted O-methyltransferase YrrM